MRSLIWTMSLATALGASASMAAAQSTDTRRLTIDTLTEVCLPFWQERDLEAALVHARQQGWRRVEALSSAEGEPTFAYRLSIDGGNALTLTGGDRPSCVVSMHEATVTGMGAAAGPVLQAAGFTPIRARRAEAADPLIGWRNASGDRVVVSLADREPRIATLVLDVGRPNDD